MSETETKANSCKLSDKFQVQLKEHINVLKSHGSKLLLLLLFTKMSLTPRPFYRPQVYEIRNSLNRTVFIPKDRYSDFFFLSFSFINVIVQCVRRFGENERQFLFVVGNVIFS